MTFDVPARALPVKPVPGAWLLVVVELLVTVPATSIGQTLNGTITSPPFPLYLWGFFPEWVNAAYPVAAGAVLLGAGGLVDRIGVRRVLCTGLGVYGAAALVAGAAPSGGVLMLATPVMGLGAGLMQVCALAAAMRRAGDRARLAGAVAAFGAAAVAGVLFGAPLAGLALDSSWRWGFWMLLPLAVLVGVLVARMPREQPTPAVPGESPVLWSASVVVLAVLVVSVEAPLRGWDIGTQAAAIVGLLALTTSVGLALRTQGLGALVRSLLGGLLAFLLLGVVVECATALVDAAMRGFYYELPDGYIGYGLLAAVVGLVAWRVMLRARGAAAVVAAGCLLLAFGFRMFVDGSTHGPVVVMALLLVVGAPAALAGGAGLALPGAPDGRVGLSAAFLATALAVGQLVGTLPIFAAAGAADYDDQLAVVAIPAYFLSALAGSSALALRRDRPV